MVTSAVHTRWGQAGFSLKVQAETQLYLSITPPNSPDFPTCLGAKSALWAPHEPNPLQDMCDCYQDCLPQEVPSVTTLTPPPHPFRPASVHFVPSIAPLLTSCSCAPLSSGREGGQMHPAESTRVSWRIFSGKVTPCTWSSVGAVQGS